MRPRTQRLWLLAGLSIVASLARPLPARAVEDPSIKIRSQILVVSDRLDRLADLVAKFFIDDPNLRREQADARAAIDAALIALTRLYEDPNLRLLQRAVLAA